MVPARLDKNRISGTRPFIQYIFFIFFISPDHDSGAITVINECLINVYRFIPLREGLCNQPSDFLVLHALYSVSIHRQYQLTHFQTSRFKRRPMLLKCYK